MEITLIRHIEPDVEKGVCYGKLDVPLVNNFSELHKQIKIKLSNNKFDAVYSSPLTRCRLLAEDLSEEIIYDNRISELSFGNWEGKKWDDINKNELSFWMKDYINTAPPNGESLNDLIKRLKLFFNELQQKPLNSVLIITHAGAIKACHHIFKNMPLNEVMMIEVKYGEVVKFESSPKS